ncbi:MAG: cobalt ECF transporter T component CbiQ [Symbiobacteriia bacterium]
MYLIDAHAYANRWRRRHPLEKLALSGGMLLLSLVLPPYPGAVVVFVVMALFTVLGAGIPSGFYVKLLLLPLGFALTSTAALAVSVAVGPGTAWHVAFSPAGARVAYDLLLRSLGAVSSLYFLALTTPMVDLLSILRRWGLPAFLLDVMLLTYRFLFVLTDIAGATRTAQASRLGYGSPRLAYRSLGLLVASLFGRVLDRARRLEYGLAARGYEGNLNVLPSEQALSVSSLGGIAALELAVIAFSYHLGGLWAWPR